MPRFVITWTDDNMSDMDVVRTADSVEEAAHDIRDLLDGEEHYDEDAGDAYEGPADPPIEDFLVPALKAFVDTHAAEGEDLEKCLEAMRVGDSKSLQCEGAELKVVRER
jgi:phytoene/squalene synthetase